MNVTASPGIANDFRFKIAQKSRATDAFPHEAHNLAVCRTFNALGRAVANVVARTEFAAPFASRLLNGGVQPIIVMQCVERDLSIAFFQVAVFAFIEANPSKGQFQRVNAVVVIAQRVDRPEITGIRKPARIPLARGIACRERDAVVRRILWTGHHVVGQVWEEPFDGLGESLR
jgi:hypothetical protein